MIQENKTEEIEINLLLEAMVQRYGYDFRGYAKSSIKRRIRGALQKSNCSKITEMTQKLLYEESFFLWFLAELSIGVTEFFRDPGFYRYLREQVIPILKTYPFVKIWDVGCATGEETYSLAILFAEENFYDKTLIFATDHNHSSLKQAKNGIYSIEKFKQGLSNFQKSQGSRSLSEYFHAQYDSAIINSSLKKNITFAEHNLVADGVFSETHLIVCRNVLIYFDKPLQKRVFKLFDESLVHKGFLGLGRSESLEFTEMHNRYKICNKKQKIYQKIADSEGINA